MTKLIRSLHKLKNEINGCVLTIGNFDGVHLGHQALVEQTIIEAQAKGVPSLVVTFEPHAFEFFAGAQLTIPRLTRMREKFVHLSDCGVDYVVILPFNHELANFSPEEFVSLLVSHTSLVKLIVGDDFRFGKKRAGDYQLLQQLSAKWCFEVINMPTLLIEGERVSSTRIREALAVGDHDLVKKCLGRSYSMQGRVRHGDKRGRDWGFPTANIFLHRKLAPVSGVYTVYMHGIQENGIPGVANIGSRPTVDGTKTLLEVHLLDFNQDIYGKYVEIEFCTKLRYETRFADFNQLKAQISRDVNAARAYFDSHNKGFE